MPSEFNLGVLKRRYQQAGGPRRRFAWSRKGPVISMQRNGPHFRRKVGGFLVAPKSTNRAESGRILPNRAEREFDLNSLAENKKARLSTSRAFLQMVEVAGVEPACP